MVAKQKPFSRGARLPEFESLPHHSLPGNLGQLVNFSGLQFSHLYNEGLIELTGLYHMSE